MEYPVALQNLGGLLNKRIWSPTLEVPGFPLFPQSSSRDKPPVPPPRLTLCLLAWIRPTSLTSSSFPVSEPRQDLRIRAAPSLGFCSTLGPCGLPGGPLALGVRGGLSAALASWFPSVFSTRP